MRAYRRTVVIMAVVFMFMLLACPIYAAQLKPLKLMGRTPKERTVNGTVFSYKATNSSRGTYALYAKRNGKTKKIYNAYDGGLIATDGITVYFMAYDGSKTFLYRSNAANPSLTRVTTFSGKKRMILGSYGNKVFYMKETWGQSLTYVYSYNLNTNKTAKAVFEHQFVDGYCKAQYLILDDWMGAGWSKVIIYNMATGKYKLISANVRDPYKDIFYSSKDNAFLFVEQIKQSYYSNMRVRKYDLSTGKITTVLKPFKAEYIQAISRRTVKYWDSNWKTHIKKW